MKKRVIIVLAILLSHLVNAQDVITKRNGDEINANILEVNKTEIKYKRFDNPDGPTFAIDASDIFMIKYANGSKDVLNPDNTMQQNNDPNAKQTELSNNPNDNASQEKMNDGNRDGGGDVTSQTAPPALPVYDQPACPTEGYLWTPGYWAFSLFRGFFWVPGVWVAAPEPGFLWTPGYWGYVSGNYRWNEGYWGPHVGYYGGISYGYGYTGSGYYGGRWEGRTFQYNTAVCNVNTTVVHNTYIDKTVVNNTSRNTYASYNGPGGSIAKPTESERIAMNENHVKPASDQISHRQMASKNENQYYSVNRGHPATTTMNKINGKSYGVEAGQPRSNAETNHTQNNNSSQQHTNIPQQKANTSINKGNNSEQHTNIPQQKNNASQNMENKTQPRNNIPQQKSSTFDNRSNNNQSHTNAPQQKTSAPQKTITPPQKASAPQKTIKQQPSYTKQNKPKVQKKNNAPQQKKNAPLPK